VIAGEFADIDLEVLGSARMKASVDTLREQITQLGLEGRVFLPGSVPREELFDRLRAARVLVLPRRAGSFSQAGLPTKVAEYLASGRPVVLTSVGDLPRYLRDGVDAYFVAPGDPGRFAARLRDALEDPHADAVGRQGRRTAAEKFDPAFHGGRILAFIGALRDGLPLGEHE